MLVEDIVPTCPAMTRPQVQMSEPVSLCHVLISVQQQKAERLRKQDTELELGAEPGHLMPWDICSQMLALSEEDSRANSTNGGNVFTDEEGRPQVLRPAQFPPEM